MQVTALAEALNGSRQSDGSISLHDLEVRLSRAGLEEFVRAVASLAQGVRLQRQGVPKDKEHPWF
jgi:hypothetical protein